MRQPQSGVYPASKTFSSHVIPTCKTGGDCHDPISSDRADVTFGADGSFTVTATLKNSAYPTSSTIDAGIRFSPIADRSFSASVYRGAFLYAEAYRHRGGASHTIYQWSEALPFFLFPFMPKDGW